MSVAEDIQRRMDEAAALCRKIVAEAQSEWYRIYNEEGPEAARAWELKNLAAYVDSLDAAPNQFTFGGKTWRPNPQVGVRDYVLGLDRYDEEPK